MIVNSPFLLPLTILPLLVYALYKYEVRRGNSRIIRFTGTVMLKSLSPATVKNNLAVCLLLVASTMLAFVYSDPQIVTFSTRAANSIVIVIDTSGSMTASDVPPSRLNAAKVAATAFIANAPKNWRISVVSYNEVAVVSLYPSLDRVAAIAVVDSLNAQGGTATGTALDLAYFVGRAGSPQKVQESINTRENFLNPKPTTVVLISDGAQTAGTVSMQDAAQTASLLGVKVFVVALGTPQGEINILSPDGKTQTVQVPPDVIALQRLAQTTKGSFVSAYTVDELGKLYTQVREEVSMEPDTFDPEYLIVLSSLLILCAAYFVYNRNSGLR